MSTTTIAKQQEISDSGSLKSSIPTGNLSIARAAGWPDAFLIPLARADDNSVPEDKRGKAPRKPIEHGSRFSMDVPEWQFGVAQDVLESAGDADYNFGLLNGHVRKAPGLIDVGEQLFAIDIDTKPARDDGQKDGLSDAAYLAIAMQIRTLVQTSFEGVTGRDEWLRETLPGRGAFIVRVAGNVKLSKKTAYYLSSGDEQLGKIEILFSGQLAAVGTYRKTGKPITWHRASETAPVPPYSELSLLPTEAEVNGLIARILGDLEKAGYAWTVTPPKKARTAKKGKGGATGGPTPKGMRSEAAHDLAMEVCGDGADRAAMCVALAESEDAGIREWYFEKGTEDGQIGREVLRLWQKGRARFIARQVIDEHKAKLSEAEMYAKTVPLWTQDFDAYRWYADRGLSGKDDSAARDEFGIALYLYGRIPVQDEFPALEAPKVNPRTGEVLPPGHSLAIEVNQVRTVDDVFDFFNQRHALAREQGKPFILGTEPDPDPRINRSVLTRSSIDEFRNSYIGHSIMVENDDGEMKPKKITSVWLNSPRMKEFTSVVFHPGTPTKPNILNLWKGFAVAPVPGDWSLMRNHIRDIICSGNVDHFDYLMKWTARMVQFPADQGEVAVVLRGGEGTGKGYFARALLTLCGKHGMNIQSSAHLVGNFNAHLRECVFLFADEAFFAGDKASIGVLKALVTEPTITIEAKHRNAITAPNFLHIVMASNEDWVVPASADARRFFVLDVSDDRKNDHAYFEAITAQMKAGGYEAMLHDLLAVDLKGFNHRNFPQTEALSTQREHSFDSFQRFLRDFLGPQAADKGWEEWYPARDLYSSYLEAAAQMMDRRPIARPAFGRRLVAMDYPEKRGYVPDVIGGSTKVQTRGTLFGDLGTARQKFEAATGTQPLWESTEDTV